MGLLRSEGSELSHVPGVGRAFRPTPGENEPDLEKRIDLT